MLFRIIIDFSWFRMNVIMFVINFFKMYLWKNAQFSLSLIIFFLFVMNIEFITRFFHIIFKIITRLSYAFFMGIWKNNCICIYHMNNVCHIYVFFFWTNFSISYFGQMSQFVIFGQITQHMEFFLFFIYLIFLV